jgi:hypothetical protein
MTTTINGLHALGFVAFAFGVPIAIAYVGDLLQARRHPPGPPQVPPMDYEAYHYGPAHAAHIARVERDLTEPLKGDPHV